MEEIKMVEFITNKKKWKEKRRVKQLGRKRDWKRKRER